MDEQRMVILSGGDLSDAELAAVTVALHRHRHRRRGARAAARQPTSRWALAARLESGGHPPIDEPTRLPR